VESELQTAWIAAASSVVVSLLALVTAAWTSFRSERIQREQAAAITALEELKNRLAQETDAARAKRDYEYEARKHLYAELYPLVFQLQESALIAANRVENLALACRRGSLAPGPDNWLNSKDRYYFNSSLYQLLAPLAVHSLMGQKLTHLDLRLDRDLHLLHFLAGRAFAAMRSDFRMITTPYPPVEFGGAAYSPPEDPDVAIAPEDERHRWRQGLYTGQIAEAVDALIARDKTSCRLKSYAEFSRALHGLGLRSADPGSGEAAQMKRCLMPLVGVLRDFHPARRPVTWRVLLAQAACYRAITAVKSDVVQPAQILAASTYADPQTRAAFDWLGDGASSVPATVSGVDLAEERDTAFAAADLFICDAVNEFATSR
jgi:hypothetical protein